MDSTSKSKRFRRLTNKKIVRNELDALDAEVHADFMEVQARHDAVEWDEYFAAVDRFEADTFDFLDDDDTDLGDFTHEYGY